MTATQPATDEAQIRQLLDKLAEAIRARDVEGLMSIYAPGIVSFDVGGPLQGVGEEAKWENWRYAFAAFDGPLGYEIRDLTITPGGDVAFAHGFARLSGTFKGGDRSDGFWVRLTACFQKIDGNWLIAHDHVSVPLDLESRRAVVNLEP
jgi:ketosteroid isomerase-like protein